MNRRDRLIESAFIIGFGVLVWWVMSELGLVGVIPKLLGF